MTKNNFANWMDQQFIKWQLREGESRTVEQFAAYLGFSRVTVSQWMNGRRTPSDARNIDHLAEKLGDEVYAVLEIEPTDPVLRNIVTHWHELPEAHKRKIGSVLGMGKP